MAKQLIAAAPRKAVIAEYQVNEIMQDEVLVKVEYAAPKHGTELTDFRGLTPFIDEYYDDEWKLFIPRDKSDKKGVNFGNWNLGNQWVGIIVKKGSNVKDYSIGDRVCSYGGIREFHVVKAVNNYRLRKVPSNMSWKNALCYDPAQFALGGVRDANVRPGDKVAIFGLGAIGQIAVQICKKMGASLVAAVDPIEMRREVALRNGADIAFDPLEADVGMELKRVTQKNGVDAVVETSGSVGALQSALRGLAYGGTISYVAFAKEFSSGLNLGKEAHFNYGKIVFSRACSEPNPDFPRWNRRRIEEVCWEMLTNGYLNCEDIIHPVVKFEDCAEAYMKYVDREPHKSIKMGVKF